jgi:hypothetical protein
MPARTKYRLILGLLAVALLAGGCKRDSDDSSSAAPPAVAAGGAVAAPAVPRDPLAGMWQVTDVHGVGQLPPELANMVDTLKTNTINLHADHTFRSFNADAGGYSGTWKSDGKSVILAKGPYENDQYPASKTLTIDGGKLLDANESYTIYYQRAAGGDGGPMVLTVGDFLSVKDEATFKEKYFDKPIQIAGTIYGINGFTGVVMLRDPADTVSVNYAQCYLMDYAAYGKLSNGQSVTLRGIAVGEVGAAALEDCEIVAAGPSTGVTIAAADLANEFAKSPDAAVQKYVPESGAKTIFLTGPLVSKDFDDGPVPHLFLGTDAAKVDCAFNADDVKRLQALKPGDEIHLAGVMPNDGSKSAELENCYIVLSK